MMTMGRTPPASRPASPTTFPSAPPHLTQQHLPDQQTGFSQPPPLNHTYADMAAAADSATPPANNFDNELYNTFNTEILGHMQDQFLQVNPHMTGAASTADDTTSTLPPQLVTLITQIVSQAIMQVQPIIMNTVSQACSKMFVMMLDRMDRQHTGQHLVPGDAAPHTTTTPLAIEHSINIVTKKQLRQQAYITDQMEQDSRLDTIRIKRVDYEDREDLTKKIIETAKDVDVILEPDDITTCYRLGGRDAANDRRVIVAKLRSNRKKVALMMNKKKLTNRRYIEEDLTKLRTNLYHTVRMDRKTIKTWTIEGKICTLVKDNDGNDIKKMITTPDDLVKIQWTEERISNFWEEFNG